MRKLASIQRIKDIQPIEGADRIECASILGWKCVVGKNEFKVGDLVVYLEVDGVTPQTETYKVLKDCGYRVKTRRFKKQISQGLCLPLSILSTYNINKEYEEGTDLTEFLNITKYVSYEPAQLAGNAKGPFPDFLHKTDETRIQAVPQVLERHKGKQFHVTEKVDGSSLSAYLYKDVFGVCSRNLDLKEDETNTFWKMAKKYNLEAKFRSIKFSGLPLANELADGIAIQGEVVGNGVQGNKYNLEEVKLFVFNIFSIHSSRYLNYDEFKNVAKALGLTTVPDIGIITLNYTVDSLVELSKDQSVLNNKVPREGIVLRPLVEEYDEDLGRLSFKIINPEFLIRYNE